MESYEFAKIGKGYKVGGGHEGLYSRPILEELRKQGITVAVQRAENANILLHDHPHSEMIDIVEGSYGNLVPAELRTELYHVKKGEKHGGTTPKGTWVSIKPEQYEYCLKPREAAGMVREGTCTLDPLTIAQLSFKNEKSGRQLTVFRGRHFDPIKHQELVKNADAFLIVENDRVKVFRPKQQKNIDAKGKGVVYIPGKYRAINTPTGKDRGKKFIALILGKEK